MINTCFTVLLMPSHQIPNSAATLSCSAYCTLLQSLQRRTASGKGGKQNNGSRCDPPSLGTGSSSFRISTMSQLTENPYVHSYSPMEARNTEGGRANCHALPRPRRSAYTSCTQWQKTGRTDNSIRFADF